MKRHIAPAARILLCAGLISMTAACATVTRGREQNWSVETTPAGAAVDTSNGFHCPSTPCNFRISRRTGFTVTITKPGYEPATVRVKSEVAASGAAGLAGNAIIGGLIGVGVDAATGATNDLKPNPLQVTLTPLGGATPAPAAP